MSDEYYFAIDDASPYLKYTPFADGAGSGGWKTYYSSSGYFLPGDEPGHQGVGDSYHVTSQPGASLSFDFYGTGFTLFGTANCSYQVVVDSEPYSGPPSSSNVLYTVAQLSQGSHYVTLTAAANTTSSQQLAFESILVANQLSDSTSKLVPNVINNQDTSALHYYGEWMAPQTSSQIPNSLHPTPFSETNSSGAGVSLTFTGGSGFAVNGTADYGGWQYLVEIDGQTVATPNASTWRMVPDALLFYRDGLDPDQQHVVNITNISRGTNMWLNSITVYKPSSDSSYSSSSSSTSPTSSTVTSAQHRSSVHAGAIAGAIVGAIIGIVIITFVILWWRRSPRRARPANTSDGHDMLGVSEMGDMNAGQFYPENMVSTTPSRLYSISSGSFSLRPSFSVREKGQQSNLPYAHQSSTSHVSAPSIFERGSVTADSSVHRPTAVTSVTRPLPPVPTAGSPPTRRPTPVDVDLLVEMVAQRIDRSQNVDHDVNTPPPEYRG